MEKEKKNKKLILLIVSILVLIIGIVGVTYAAFSFTKTGVVSKLVTGDIYMKYTEGSSINLSGAMPSNSYPTKASGNYFQFQIAGKNTSDGSVSYTLKLAHGDVPDGKSSSNRIEDGWLYFKLVEVTNLGANNETETTLVNDAHYTTIPNAVLYTTSIPAGTSSTLTKTYRLYARIHYNLTIGNTNSANYSESQWNSLFASIKLNAEGGYAEPTSNTIPLCPDCEFMYTTNEYEYGASGTTRTKIVDTDGVTLSSNYNDVITETRKIFLGVKFSGDKVEKAYACGIENDIPFCLEGYTDISKQSANINVLTGSTPPIFSSCSESLGSDFSCSGSVDAYAGLDGFVDVDDGSGNCYVNSIGHLGCDEYIGSSPPGGLQ